MDVSSGARKYLKKCIDVHLNSEYNIVNDDESWIYLCELES